MKIKDVHTPEYRLTVSQAEYDLIVDALDDYATSANDADGKAARGLVNQMTCRQVKYEYAKGGYVPGPGEVKQAVVGFKSAAEYIRKTYGKPSAEDVVARAEDRNPLTSSNWEKPGARR